MPRLPVPELPWFEEWMKKTGETFDDPLKLPSIPDLPDLLRMQDGTAIRDPSMWSRRRSELWQLLFHYMIGHRPDERPPLLQADPVCETRSPAGVWRSVRLTFGAPVPVSFEIQLRTPPGGGPFPLFLTQSGHAGWGHIALSRGYGVCLYPGDDSDDASAALTEAYPECDWTLLHRRAYLASLALDYLLQSGEADPDRIAITGHSRNGKQSLIAAACEERIRAVIDASSGTGGSHPFRFSSENYFGESVEMMTRNFPEWFHPRLRLFTGVEDRLPVDCHATVALIAPRACLISVAHNDPTGTLLGAERVWQAARQAYRLLGRERALSYAPRPGGHEIGASVVHAYLDWLDGVFGLGGQAQGAPSATDNRVWRFDWHRWAADQPRPARLPAQGRSNLKEAVLGLMGEAPPEAPSVGGRASFIPEHLSALLSYRSRMESERIRSAAVQFGEHLSGWLFYPAAERDGPLPVVIWLHPFSFPTGINGGYQRGQPIMRTLAEQGFAVLAFDQIGFGSRLLEGARFYDRYPRWSLLGKMVRDVRHAADLVARPDSLPVPLDPGRIFCLGYSLGGAVALHAAALDDRIAGVASWCGFTPMRGDSSDRPTGGNRRWYEGFPLLPQLGFYEGRERDIPYDYDDLLALIAPRPCLIHAPQYDRQANGRDVADCVDRAGSKWAEQGAADLLSFRSPPDYNRLQEDQHAEIVGWLKGVLR